MEITGAVLVTIETSRTEWLDLNPIWRLAHLVESYGSPEVFSILCMTLMQIGHETVRAGLSSAGSDPFH